MSTGLHDALAARDAAATHHCADTEALDRGRERLATAQAELDRLTQEDTAAVTRHARRLEAATREGRSTPVPDLVPSDRHLRAQLSAQRAHAASQQMVASLEAAEKQSRAALSRADAAMQDANRAVDTALVRQLDERRTALLQELEEVTETIAAVMLDTSGAVPPEVDARCNAHLTVPTIELALQQANFLVRDINTPVGMRHAAIAAARERWQQLRAQALAADEAAQTERAA